MSVDQITMYTIKESLLFVFKNQNITTQERLHEWCDFEKQKLKRLYELIERLSPEHYRRLRKPDAVVRNNLQPILHGYKNFKVK